MTYQTPDLHLAPGCFGSALTYKESQVECQTCPFAERCKPISEARMERLRAKLGIAVKPAKPVVERKQIVKDAGVMTLPKKVEELMERIDRAGIKITESLREGRNPFADKKKPAFLLVACHLLLHLSGNQISRQGLCEAFMKKFEWSEGTAAAHALQASQLLVAVGAATETDGRISLKR